MADIDNFIQYLDASSDKFTQNLNYSIERLGTATFVDIIQKGLLCISKQNKNDDTLSTIKSITKQLKYQNNKTTINFANIFDTETTISLCSFLSIHDQIHLKQTCYKFNQDIEHININQHNWIGIPYHMDIYKLCQLCNHIQLKQKTFNKIKMIGEAQYDHDDIDKNSLFSSLGLDIDMSKMSRKRSPEESEQRRNTFCLQMGFWLFIATNICSNKGIFITPKLEIRSGFVNFISQMDKFFKEKTQLYQNIKYCKKQLNIPRKILFQANDSDSVSLDATDFFLEQMVCCFENIKSLFVNNREIRRIFIVRKYTIFDTKYATKYHELLLNRCGCIYGKPFGNQKNKFVTLKRSKNGYYTAYLKFNRRLIDLYTPRTYSDEDHDD